MASAHTLEDVRPLRRVEYDRLVALGMFEDERLELLAGALVRMTPHGPDHSAAVTTLQYALIRALGDRALVRVQCPFAASDDSEPEPDLAVVPPGDYRDAHPDRAFLIVEVARTSLVRGREVKAAIYAAAGVPEYWVVNLVDRVVEVHREPVDERYGSVSSHRAGEQVALAAFLDVTVELASVVR